jgi:hypothetical protein
LSLPKNETKKNAMAHIEQKDKATLTVKSFPKCIYGLATGMLVFLLLAALRGSRELDITGVAIFGFVCLVFMLIQQSRVTIFNKPSGKVVWQSASMFGKKEITYSLDQVQSVEMSYAKGSGHARGGSIRLHADGVDHAIADSDICFSNRLKNKRLCQEINEWLSE